MSKKDAVIGQGMSQQDRDRDHYDRGADDGYALAENDARIAAFGAIRRAAQVARWWQAEAEQYENHNMIAFNESANVADGIRQAIRAAIGSPKQ